MTRILTQALEIEESIWAVTVENEDDGLRDTIAHLTDSARAHDHARRKGGSVIQIPLWRDPKTGEYYRPRLERVPVDIPDREEILAKLTDREKEALGLVK